MSENVIPLNHLIKKELDTNVFNRVFKYTNEFGEERFHPIRIFKVEDTIYVVAKDVAKALNYRNTTQSVISNCKKRITVNELMTSVGLTTTEINGLHDLDPKTVLIKEPDVYRLIMRSAKPEAELLQDWVAEEVLPEIRKAGMYNSGAQQALFVSFAKSQMEMAEAIVSINRKINELQEPIKFRGVGDKQRNVCMDIGSLSDYIFENYKVKIGRNTLYSYLRNLNWVEQGNTKPTVFALNYELLGIEAAPIEYEDGLIGTAIRTVINKKSIHKFIEYLQLQNILPEYNLTVS